MRQPGLVTNSEQRTCKNIHHVTVKFRNKTDAAVADLCQDASNPCFCNDGDTGTSFGLALLTCPGNDPDDLLEYLMTLPYEFIRVEENKQYVGGGITSYNSSEVFESTSAACQLANRFTAFPQLSPRNWGLDRCDQNSPLLDSTYNVQDGLTGCGVHVYIMDSGLYSSHNEFQGRVRNGYNVITKSSDPNDDNSHGTHCMGIAAGRESGVAKDAFIHGVKALDASGIGSSSRIFAGLEWIYRDIIENGRFPAVLSLSIAAPGDDQTMNDVMKEFYDAGVFVVAASGNYNKDACAFTPANSNHVFTVGATEMDDDQEDVRASYSNFGACVDVWAPGTDIVSTGIGSQDAYLTKSGTSMAAPLITGIAALYLQNHPTTSPGTLQDILKAGFVETPTIVTKEKSTQLIVAAPLMCSINSLETCTDISNCMVSAVDDWSDCPPSDSVCGQHLQKRHLRIDQQPTCGGTSFVYNPCGNAVPAQWLPRGDISLSSKIWRLIPVADDAYTSCFEQNSETAPENHPSIESTVLDIPDDSSIEYMLPGVFKFFGREYLSVHVGSNGYLTFGSGDFRYASVPEEKPAENLLPIYQNIETIPLEETAPEAEIDELGVFIDYSQEFFEAEGRRLLEYQGEIPDSSFGIQDNLASTDAHWDKHRISAWFQDLDPSSGATRISVQQVNDGEKRVIINYSNIPCYTSDTDSSSLNTFQITLWLEGSSKAGSVQIWWGELANCKGAIVGLSPGYKPNDWKSSILNTDVSSCGVDGNPVAPPLPPSGTPEEPFVGQGSSPFSLFS
eukprot:g202.t1